MEALAEKGLARLEASKSAARVPLKSLTFKGTQEPANVVAHQSRAYQLDHDDESQDTLILLGYCICTNDEDD
jgi:hypothetical protein